jgi:predicted secreted acid phosphatase
MRSVRFRSAVVGASALTLAAGVLAGAGTAQADGPLAPRTSFAMVVDQADGSVAAPTDGEAIPNIDSVKSTIRAYYNATGGIASKKSSRYIDEVAALERRILLTLDGSDGNDAVVFDADDTLLWNYDFEDNALNFNFDPSVQNTWVAEHRFPAVPGMPQLVHELIDRGYEIYGITGRRADQEADTVANLTEKGYTDDLTPGGTPIFTAANMYTKDPVTTGPPASISLQPWVDCAADGNNTSCSTVEFKALTRQHIETTDGVDIVMNVGDQWSDLQGGHADHSTKLPNPTYFLPSPNIAGAPASDVTMVPPTSYVMEPDGSSGRSVRSGDDIPNVDPVRRMIRAYYNASSGGIANKVTSPYVSQLTALESAWTPQVTSSCTRKSQARNAALLEQQAASAAVDAARAAAHKAAKKVAKAKKKLKRATTAKQRKAAAKQLKKARKALKKKRAKLAAAREALHAITVPASPALVFDADDTTLWTYDMEDGEMKFVFDPVRQGAWVSGHLFQAVPGMPQLVKAGAASGCTVFGLTGRGASQQADTVANLTEKGYVDAAGTPLFSSAHFFTKGPVVVSSGDATIPTQPWVDCGGDGACSTIEYKSGTRAYIEQVGFDIVGNFGDQWSDLIGGHASHTYKLPNPTYYLP